MNSNNRLYAWLNLRSGEGKSASLMLLHSFFMGISTVFFETAASALFLAQFDATTLPFVYLAAAAVSISTGLTYTRLKDRLAFTPLMVGTLGLLFLLVCLMRLGLSVVQASWLVFSMMVLFFTLNREDFSFVIHLDRQPRTSRRREAQTGSRARSGSRSERTLDAVEHSRTLMEWWPFLIFHRGGLRIKVINNRWSPIGSSRSLPTSSSGPSPRASTTSSSRNACSV